MIPASGCADVRNGREAGLVGIYDPAIIGKVFEETDPVGCQRKEIASICTAIGETNPLYSDEEAASKGPYGGLIAPPRSS